MGIRRISIASVDKRLQVESPRQSTPRLAEAWQANHSRALLARMDSGFPYRESANVDIGGKSMHLPTSISAIAAKGSTCRKPN